jgi:hypothetical protein
MKSINNSSVFSHLIVFVLTIAILTGQTMFVLALPEKNSAAGEITVTATADASAKPFVLVNGEQAFSGRTFFSNGTITTPESSSASIDFGKIGRINLGPASSLTLSVTETTISGTLSTGTVRVANGEGVGVKIVTPDDTVSNEGTSASRFTVNVVSDASSVVAQSGAVRYNNGATLARQDDDDDDDDGMIWLPVVVFGGAIAAVLFFSVLKDDDDVVSPIR